jgi:hypothetical protein
MALVGERNAKEHMRTVSNWQQLMPMAAAPLGILSILVSAIRLSGPGFLTRLVGRDSERRGDALVEVTSLSVNPATSVYTPRAVEVEPYYAKDRVAFACAHVRDIKDCNQAVEAFREMLLRRATTTSDDRDREIVLALWKSSAKVEETAKLVQYVERENLECPALSFTSSSSAALSFRTSGVSPTLTGSPPGGVLLLHLRDVLVSIAFMVIIEGIQVLAWRLGETTTATFAMGTAGYAGVVLSTLSLLLLVKSETIAKAERLPALFSNAYWTFSDSRHAEHKPMRRPSHNTLYSARARVDSRKERLQRGILTTALAVLLIGSYITYYLAVRVAPWWVAFAGVGTIWVGAAYRAAFDNNFLVATSDSTGKEEHWIGMFRNTAAESLLATLEAAHRRPTQPLRQTTTTNSKLTGSTYVMVQTDSISSENEKPKSSREDFETSTVLLLVPPIRTALRTWSSMEDVMKVGIEVAKYACRKRIAAFEAISLKQGQDRSQIWDYLVRFPICIYVPGLMWKSNTPVDFALPQSFDIESLIRYVIKLLHVCMDHEGTITYHDVDSQTSIDLSHVLCGPIAQPAIDRKFDTASTPTLRQLLEGLRDNKANTACSKYSLEQSVLLPTATLCAIYDRYARDTFAPGGDNIQRLQSRHVDHLALSGAPFLPTLEREFEKLGVWSDILGMELRDMEGEEAFTANAKRRDERSGDYRWYNVRDTHVDTSRVGRPPGEDGDVGRGSGT